MENKSNTPQYATISAILLFVAAVLQLPVIFRQFRVIFFVGASGTTPLWLLTNLAIIGGEIWLGLNLMKQKRDKPVVLGIAVLTGAVLLQLILGFDPASHTYTSQFRDAFSLWIFLPYLLEAAGYALLLVFAHYMVNTDAEKKA